MGGRRGARGNEETQKILKNKNKPIINVAMGTFPAFATYDEQHDDIFFPTMMILPRPLLDPPRHEGTEKESINYINNRAVCK